MKKYLITIVLCAVCSFAQAQFYTTSSDGKFALTNEGADHFSALALKCILQEFPNKTQHVQVDSSDMRQPSGYHPTFYGCFDWHSAVHGHWMLVKLLKEFPEMSQAATIRAAIAKNITPKNIQTELAYFGEKYNKSYERTYGWAWLLKLAEELSTWDDAQGKEWLLAIEPLVKHIVNLYLDFLPKQNFPIRTGVHQNTAFGLSLALDYALTVRDTVLENSIKKHSLQYFKNDENCPAEWEPSGTDFLSPCLVEAELMTKVLSKNEYEIWLQKFLPELQNRSPKILFSPISVSDRSDGYLVHLDGLNLSRAWCFLAIANITDDEKTQIILHESAQQHLNKTVPNIADGDYMGEHWLASFVIYALFMGK